jgi:hypothetical protein
MAIVPNLTMKRESTPKMKNGLKGKVWKSQKSKQQGRKDKK